MSTATAAIVGSGNIGTDLLAKLAASDIIDVRYMVGIDPESEGLRRAADQGIEVSAQGVDWLVERPELPAIVFEATSARVHAANAPLYRAHGIRAVDLTPAAVGPYVVPSVNLHEHLHSDNVNLITCGGQATIPIVHSVSRVTRVGYAEIVATVASASAGPGTRANIDEFTQTTAMGVGLIGGAERGKAIIVLNPADPPIIMRNTVYCSIGLDPDEEAIATSIKEMVAEVQSYVPGYRMLSEPQFDVVDDLGSRVTVFLEVVGAGDFLPAYAGNLDIMTSAAVRVGEAMVEAAMESSR